VTTPVFYAVPETVGGTLDVEPALANWDRAGSPGQVRSAAFIAGVHTILSEQLAATPDPLSLRLDIGLLTTIDHDGHGRRFQLSISALR
jgi:hypothetical protein